MDKMLEDIQIVMVTKNKFIIPEPRQIFNYVNKCINMIDNGLPKVNSCVSDIMNEDLFETLISRVVAMLVLDKYPDIVSKEYNVGVVVDIQGIDNRKYSISVSVINSDNESILLYGVIKE